MPAAAPGAKFSTGLCDCCAEPGGCGLCMVTYCCPCFVCGKNAEGAKLSGGYWLGCCLSLIPIVNAYWGCQAAVKTLESKPGNPKPDEMMEFLKVCCCPACSVCRIRREQQILDPANTGYFPANEQSMAMLKDNKMPNYASCALD